jgi:hypothetical protein
VLEELFQVHRHCGIGWTEAWDLPITIRRWLIEREKKERTAEAEMTKKAQKSRKG